MDNNRTRRILAIAGLVFMAIFSVSLVIVFISPTVWNGAVGYIALISGLLGISMFIVVKFVLKSGDEKTDKPYLPNETADENSEKESGGEAEKEQATDESRAAEKKD